MTRGIARPRKPGATPGRPSNFVEDKNSMANISAPIGEIADELIVELRKLGFVPRRSSDWKLLRAMLMQAGLETVKRHQDLRVSIQERSR